MQSNGARIAVAVLSVAAIVVLFVVLSGGDDDESTTTTPVAESTTTETTGSGNGNTEKPDKPVNEEPDVALIELVGGEPKGGPLDLEFTKGDEVRFDVESDTEEELHIHGYDLYEDVVPGKVTEVAFPAEIDGVFEIESHNTGVLAAELTVTP